MPRENSAGAIIFRIIEGVPHYLILRYPSKHWEFAKGHIEKNETVEQTVIREIEEETSIKDAKIIAGFKEYSKYFFRKNYNLKGEAKKKAPWVFKLVIFLLAETKTEDIKISKEHIDFAWLSFEKAVKKVTFKNAKELLKRANRFVEKYEKQKQL